MLDRKSAADLYLNLLVPWEMVYKNLPIKGSFDIRSKEFTVFKRDNELLISILNTKAEVDKEVKANTSFGVDIKQIIILHKGDNSRARSVFKHLRNSVAHAHVDREKIKNKWYLLFSAKSDGKYVIKAQIQESKLGELIAAIKSTAKNV